MNKRPKLQQEEFNRHDVTGFAENPSTDVTDFAENTSTDQNKYDEVGQSLLEKIQNCTIEDGKSRGDDDQYYDHGMLCGDI